MPSGSSRMDTAENVVEIFFGCFAEGAEIRKTFAILAYKFSSGEDVMAKFDIMKLSALLNFCRLTMDFPIYGFDSAIRPVIHKLHILEEVRAV